jgi:hypothetical protein
MLDPRLSDRPEDQVVESWKAPRKQTRKAESISIGPRWSRSALARLGAHREEFHPKGCTFARRRLNLDAPTMHFDDLLGDDEPEAGATLCLGSGIHRNYPGLSSCVRRYAEADAGRIGPSWRIWARRREARTSQLLPSSAMSAAQVLLKEVISASTSFWSGPLHLALTRGPVP